MRSFSYREQLTKREQIVWDKATTLFEDLLDDFSRKDLLRKGIDHESRRKLSLIWANSRLKEKKE
jgi:hypothetical protein